MTDMEMVFLKKESINDKASRILDGIAAAKQFEKEQEEKGMLIDICNMIANSTTKEEYDYWCARKDQFFNEGAAAVQATITDDIAEGFYPEETFPWTRSEA